MKDEILKAEKIVRYLIETGLIRVFNLEDDIKQYLNDINKYKWLKGTMYECHEVALKFLNQILLGDEFLYFSYFKWIVLWLKLKQIYRIPEEGRNAILQEFLTVKECLKTGDIRRSGHQFANPFTEIYHIYAHYTDTRKSPFYHERFRDLRLEESFLKGTFPLKLKHKSIVEKCFSYYLFHLPDVLFIERYKCPTTDEINTENCQSVEYHVNNIKGVRYRYKNRGKWMQWWAAIMYQSNEQ